MLYKAYRRFQVACSFQGYNDDERPRRLSTSSDDPHVNKINTLCAQNRRLTIKELAEECGISVGSCYEILTIKLKMRRVTAKFLPRLLTDDQKANRVRFYQELLDRSDEDGHFLSRIITSDESWVYGYDIETKVESLQRVGQTSQRKILQVRSNVKVMLTVF